jgi:hypothetical protein
MLGTDLPYTSVRQPFRPFPRPMNHGQDLDYSLPNAVRQDKWSSGDDEFASHSTGSPRFWMAGKD